MNSFFFLRFFSFLFQFTLTPSFKVVNVVFDAVGVRLSALPERLGTVTEYDVEDFTATISGAGMLQNSEACALVLRSKSIDTETDQKLSTRLLERALELYQRAEDRSGAVTDPNLLIYVVKALSGDFLHEVEVALGELSEKPAKKNRRVRRT